MSAWFTLIASSCTHISWMVFGLKFVLISVLILINTLFILFCVLNDIEGVRIPCLCILYSNAKILNYARTLGSFLISFRALFLSYHDIFFCPIGSLDLLIACFIRWSFLNYVIFLQSLILNIVCFPPNICRCIRAFDSTQFMINAHLGEELILYWPSKFVIHFGTWCQWGRSLEGLREMVLYLRLVCS